MDKDKLIKELQPYINELRQDGIKVEGLSLCEVYEGSRYTPFYVDVCIPSVTADNYDYVVDKVYDTIWPQISDATRKYIFTLCVVNECEGERRCCPIGEPNLAEVENIE